MLYPKNQEDALREELKACAAYAKDEGMLAWLYNEDLTACLPELVWQLTNGAVSMVRYHYYDHIAEHFTSAFSVGSRFPLCKRAMPGAPRERPLPTNICYMIRGCRQPRNALSLTRRNPSRETGILLVMPVSLLLFIKRYVKLKEIKGR